MSRFLKDAWQNLTPYVPGEQPRDMLHLIKLNTNENPYPPAPEVQRILDGGLAGHLRLYPDPQCKALKEAFASYYEISVDNVSVSNGSDEMLAFAFQAFGQNGVAYPDLSYGFYKVFAETYGLKAVEVPLKPDFSLSVDDYRDVKGTIFIANPNAPTGLAVSVTDIERLLNFDRNRLVVIDEAYVFFGAESVIPLIASYDNLLVISTFSKSRSLAGARLGYALGDRSIINDLERVRFSFNPYNVNSMTMAAGIAALKSRAYYLTAATNVKETRKVITEGLRSLGVTVVDSQANFVLAGNIPGLSGYDYYSKLRNLGILVRYLEHPKLKNMVRISVGTDDDAYVLLAATKTIIEEN